MFFFYNTKNTKKKVVKEDSEISTFPLVVVVDVVNVAPTPDAW